MAAKHTAKKSNAIAWVCLICFVAVIVASWRIFRTSLWGEIVSRSFTDSWMLVIEKGVASTLVCLAVWAVETWRGAKQVNGWKLKVAAAISSLFAPISVLLGVFVIFLLGVTPATMVSEARKSENTKEARPIPIDVNVKTEDNEARRQITSLSNELALTRDRLQVANNELALVQQQIKKRTTPERLYRVFDRISPQFRTAISSNIFSFDVSVNETDYRELQAIARDDPRVKLNNPYAVGTGFDGTHFSLKFTISPAVFSSP